MTKEVAMKLYLENLKNDPVMDAFPDDLKVMLVDMARHGFEVGWMSYEVFSSKDLVN